MMLSAGSCDRRIVFDPDFHKANHNIEAIVSERQDVIYCYEEKFSEFACMSKEKIKELRRLIQDAPMPAKTKSELLKIIK